jgi:hypothetical protein
MSATAIREDVCYRGGHHAGAQLFGFSISSTQQYDNSRFVYGQVDEHPHAWGDQEVQDERRIHVIEDMNRLFQSLGDSRRTLYAHTKELRQKLDNSEGSLGFKFHSGRGESQYVMIHCRKCERATGAIYVTPSWLRRDPPKGLAKYVDSGEYIQAGNERLIMEILNITPGSPSFCTYREVWKLPWVGPPLERAHEDEHQWWNSRGWYQNTMKGTWCTPDQGWRWDVPSSSGEVSQ